MNENEGINGYAKFLQAERLKTSRRLRWLRWQRRIEVCLIGAVMGGLLAYLVVTGMWQ